MAEAKQRQGHGETCRCFRLNRRGASERPSSRTLDSNHRREILIPGRIRGIDHEVDYFFAHLAGI